MVACPNVPEAVFVDTNLGTHIAVPVSPEIIAKDFKREVEVMHLNCFPQIGNIRVKGLMVKRNLYCYHLSESFPLKYAFRGSNDAWCLHIDAIRVHSETNPYVTHVLDCNPADDSNDPLNSNDSSSCIYSRRIKSKRKKSKIHRLLSFRARMPKLFGHATSCKKRRSRERAENNSELKRISKIDAVAEINYDGGWKSRAAADTPNETLSETVSISGIIKKYFSDYDEVASSPCTPFSAVGNTPRELPNSVAYCNFLNGGFDLVSPPSRVHVGRHVRRKPASEPSRQKGKKPEVGRRLLLASKSLGLTRSCNRPVISLCNQNNSKSPGLVRNLVFELNDEGD